MKKIKQPYLLCFFIALMLFPFMQPINTSAERAPLADISTLATVSSVEADGGFLEPVTDWFGSVGDSIENTIDGVEETVKGIVNYIGELIGTVDEAISSFSSGNTYSSDGVEEIQEKVNQADDLLKKIGIKPKSGEKIVYRVLPDKQDISEGIKARRPDRNMSIAGHVRNGSKENFKGSQFISTTKSFDVALDNARYDINNDRKPQDLRIVRIDLNKVTNKYYDLTDPEIQEKYLVTKAGKPFQMVRNYANSSQEVLVEKFIPKEAFELIGRPSEFMN
ncbi:DUF7587 domain-containing protein [Gracilibacillus dipsosauri]|uniref:DUF7587 domain-containing protein n=1 Tax=Gracilibacillus dipsosauri TaxID=178340 RepID=A0A317L4C1_9BACI|nr:hypothetical protein [Gracilibacillus dipsosauri]PWU70366.1 hypothetical protein DLJ74_00565 [Gracilibacillus dipsosauri]